VQCSACDCDDHTVCTLDACDAATGVCSATAVPECQLVRVEFSGVVDQVFGTPSPVSVGMPVEGSYIVDPAAPDYNPLNPAVGAYDSAARSLEIHAGQPVALAAVSPIGLIHVFDDDLGLGDTYFVDFSGILVTTPADLPGESASISLSHGDLATFVSDALPVVPPDVSSFSETSLRIGLSVGEDVSIRASAFTLTTPEPNASALAGIAATALLALRSRRGRESVR
jgi:hypothetical protein